MDYKKAYKDMVQRCRELYETGNALTKKQMEIVRDELTESEDEKIRKVFLSFIDNYLFWESDGLSKEKALAWLERQKEQKPELCDMGRWDEESYNNGIHHVLQNPEAYGLTKQKEPHYTKRNALFDKCVENCDPAIMKEVSDNVDKMLEKDLKPAEGSDEDVKSRCPLNTKEIKVGDIVTYFRNRKKGIMLVSSFDADIFPRCKWGISDIGGTAYGDWAPGFAQYYAATEKEKQQLYDTMPTEVKDWLKSLLPQPKEEREPMEIKYGGKIYQVLGMRTLPGGASGYIIEDEPGHYDCIMNPEEVLGGGYGVKQNGSPYPTKEATFDYPHWKPSEEQMEALNEVINTLAVSKHPHESDYLFNMLNGLRKNLNKL